jgi:hypothetical protein
LKAAKKKGYGVYLVTFTLQHSHDDRLEDLVKALKDAYTRLKRGSPWERIEERFGIVGHITATEGTHGGNGWHPHLHALFFTEKPLSERDKGGLASLLSFRFVTMVKRVGRYASDYHAVDLRDGQAACDYVTKWGLENELTNHDEKDGHGDTAFQLLSKYGKGDKLAGNLFREWALTMKGKKQMVWSQGLRDLFGLDAEMDDLTLSAVDEEQAEPVMVMTHEQWGIIRGAGLRSQLLDVIESIGVEAAWALLACLGLPRSDLNDRMLERQKQARREQVKALGQGLMMRELEQAIAKGNYEDLR